MPQPLEYTAIKSKIKQKHAILEFSEYLFLIQQLIKGEKDKFEKLDKLQRYQVIYPGIESIPTNKQKTQDKQKMMWGSNILQTHIRQLNSNNHPNLLYQSITQNICSLFQAIDQGQDELVQFQKQQILQQIDDYNRRGGDYMNQYRNFIECELDDDIYNHIDNHRILLNGLLNKTKLNKTNNSQDYFNDGQTFDSTTVSSGVVEGSYMKKVLKSNYFMKQTLQPYLSKITLKYQKQQQQNDSLLNYYKNENKPQNNITKQVICLISTITLTTK